MAAAALPAARAALALGGGRAAAAKQPAPLALRFVAQLLQAPPPAAPAGAAAPEGAEAWGAVEFAQQLLTEAEHVWLLLLSKGVQPARNRPYAVALFEVRPARAPPGRAGWATATQRAGAATRPTLSCSRAALNALPPPPSKVAASLPLSPGAPGLGMLLAIAQRLAEQCAPDAALSKAAAALLSRLGALEADGAPAPDPEDLESVVEQLRGMCLTLEPPLAPEAGVPGSTLAPRGRASAATRSSSGGGSTAGGVGLRTQLSRASAASSGRRSYAEAEERDAEDWAQAGGAAPEAAAAAPTPRRSSRGARASGGAMLEATVEEEEEGPEAEEDAQEEEEQAEVQQPELEAFAAAPAWVGRRRGGGGAALSPAAFDDPAPGVRRALTTVDLLAASDEDEFASEVGGDEDAWHSADERGASRSPEDAPGARQPFGLSANTNSPARGAAAPRRASGGKPAGAATAGARRVPAAAARRE
jgi:hypothetical protein